MSSKNVLLSASDIPMDIPMDLPPTPPMDKYDDNNSNSSSDFNVSLFKRKHCKNYANTDLTSPQRIK